MFRNNAVGNPDALISHMSQVALRARLGDPDRLTAASTSISTAIEFVLRNAELVSKLPGDMTRPSAPEKAAAARELAHRSMAMLRITASTLKDKSKALSDRSQEEARRALGLSNDRLESEIRQYISTSVKTADGMAEVSKLARSNAKVASVIYGSPHFLLGLSSDLANKMKFEMIEHWCPDAYADMEMVAELERVIPGYDRLEREIGSTWFSPALAAQADTRVNIEG